MDAWARKTAAKTRKLRIKPFNELSEPERAQFLARIENQYGTVNALDLDYSLAGSEQLLTPLSCTTQIERGPAAASNLCTEHPEAEF